MSKQKITNRMKLRKLFLVIGLASAAITMSAQSSFDVKLYNGRPPYNNGDESDTAKVRVFLPMEKQATGRAVVICPGGGHGWGSKIGFRYHEEMMMDLKAWLKSF